MPSRYSPLNAFTSPVTTWADGDLDAAAGINAGWQSLADQRNYLQQIATVTGATLIQSGTVTAMQAVASPVNGSVFYVTGQGIYVWTAGDSTTTDGYLVLAGGSGQGSGRWKHMRYATMNASLGVAGVGVAGGAAGRIPAGIIPNTIVATASGTLTSDQTFSTTIIDVPGMTASVTAVAGDKVHYWAHFFMTGGSNNDQTQLAVTDGGSTSTLSVTHSLVNSSTGASYRSLRSVGIYTAVNAGTITVKGQFGSPPGSGDILKAGSTVRVRLRRP